MKRSSITCAAPANAAVGVAVTVGAAEHDVAAVLGEQQRCAVGERGVHVDHGVERLDVELDQCGRVLGDRSRFGDDDRQRFADQPHDVAGERGVRRREQPVATGRHHVL